MQAATRKHIERIQARYVQRRIAGEVHDFGFCRTLDQKREKSEFLLLLPANNLLILLFLRSNMYSNHCYVPATLNSPQQSFSVCIGYLLLLELCGCPGDFSSTGI